MDVDSDQKMEITKFPTLEVVNHRRKQSILNPGQSFTDKTAIIERLNKERLNGNLDDLLTKSITFPITPKSMKS